MADTDDSREARDAARVRAWKASHREQVRARTRDLYAANREEIRAKRRKWDAENPDKCRATVERRRAKLRAEKPPNRAYSRQKSQAKQRGIPFLITFDEWWAIWDASGKWEQRGTRLGQYCMARFGDVGPYAADNVRICSVSENHSEVAGWKQTDAARKAISVAATARYARARHFNDDPLV